MIGRAIAAGKHVFTEKILAPTVAEAEELVDLAREAGVALVVSLPRLYDDYTVAIERILDEGTLGELTYSRVRLAHDGWVAGWLPERFGDPEAAIGGALTDLGCHPAYLTRLFHRAEPLAISASYGSVTGRAVEDNAVVTAEFPGGRLGVFEASVVTTPGAFTIELRGTEASRDVRLRRRAPARQGRSVRRRVAGAPAARAPARRLRAVGAAHPRRHHRRRQPASRRRADPDGRRRQRVGRDRPRSRRAAPSR